MKYDSKNPRHKLAKKFATAFIANRTGLTFRSAQNYTGDEVGSFWIFLADLAFKGDEENVKATFKDYFSEPETITDSEN